MTMSSNVVKFNEMNLGTTVQVQPISTKNLTSGAKYQRTIDHKKVEKIVSTYDPHKVGVIKVSYRDDNYWVYDGQHRLMALKTINHGKDCMVLCEVHYGLTYEDEARLFAEQYDGATKVDIVYQMGALLEAKDEDVVKIKDIVESTGLQIPFTKSKGNDKIVAVSKIRTIYKDLQEDGLRRILTLIKQTWNGTSSSLDKYVLGGMHQFLKTYKTEISDITFIKNLSKIEPLMIKRVGDSDMSAKGDLKYAKVILDYYNKGLTSKSRLEYNFKG
jgi:hypothetical protein